MSPDGLPMTEKCFGEIQITIRQVARTVSQEVIGSNPGAGKEFSHIKYLFKCVGTIILL